MPTLYVLCCGGGSKACLTNSGTQEMCGLESHAIGPRPQAASRESQWQSVLGAPNPLFLLLAPDPVTVSTHPVCESRGV